MRLGTYSPPGLRQWRAALFLSDSTLLDLGHALQSTKALPDAVATPAQGWTDHSDIMNWITPAGQALARHIKVRAETGDFQGQLLELAAVEHGPPVPRPGKFIAVGRNYMNHVREGQKIWAARGKTVALPTFPASFVKFSSGIVAHGMPIVLPEGVEDIDYELELAFVIGKPAYKVSRESALDYVAGYTICNDVAARKIQRLEMEAQIGITMAKNFRSFAPTGPWLVTADDIPDPQNLEISLTVNGDERQQANTSDMIFPIAELVAYWSQIGLEPGDMITTGTPSGVALARSEPERYYLRDGDVVKATIEGIGVLTNPVRAESRAN